MTKEALRLALEALIEVRDANIIGLTLTQDYYDAITAIKEALAQPEQKSIAMADYMALTEKYVALKAAQRTWVGLTDEDKESFWKADQMSQEEWDDLFSAIEAKLKEKNNG
jgi:hypothetical protein